MMLCKPQHNGFLLFLQKKTGTKIYLDIPKKFFGFRKKYKKMSKKW